MTRSYRRKRIEELKRSYARAFERRQWQLSARLQWQLQQLVFAELKAELRDEKTEGKRA